MNLNKDYQTTNNIRPIGPRAGISSGNDITLGDRSG